MNLDNLRFTKEHEWVAAEDGSEVVTIGITDFAQGELGDVVFVELPEVGAELKASDTMGTIEAVKTVADLFAPLSGVVAEVNGALEDDPGVVNKSPFEDGWFIKMKMSDRTELEALLSHGAYKEMIGAE
jgi:glycine cleavage system H protein